LRADHGGAGGIEVTLFGLLAVELLGSVLLAQSGSNAILLAALVGAAIALITVALFKGRWALVVVGFVGLFVHGLGALLWPWGAIRLAKPDSAWAKAFYGSGRLERAKARYAPPGQPAADPSPAERSPTVINLWVDARSLHLHGGRGDSQAGETEDLSHRSQALPPTGL
jgi:hypothetical protein